MALKILSKPAAKPAIAPAPAPTEPTAAQTIAPVPAPSPEPLKTLEPAPAAAEEDTPWGDSSGGSEEGPAYTILDALEELYQGKAKGTLVLIHNETKAVYVVKSYDLETGRAVLIGPHKAVLNPRVGEREVSRYTPFWR